MRRGAERILPVSVAVLVMLATAIVAPARTFAKLLDFKSQNGADPVGSRRERQP